jgi:hypothetical protein
MEVGVLERKHMKPVASKQQTITASAIHTNTVDTVLTPALL